MQGEKKIRQILKQVLALSRADQTEVLFVGQDSYLTRFANSYIHQNVAESSAELRIRVAVGKRIGVASTNDLSPMGLEKAVEATQIAARFQPERPDFVSLPGPKPIPAVNGFSEATAAFTPEDRARAVGTICEQARSEGLVASGAFTTARREMAVANSLGIMAYHPSTFANLNTVIMSEDSSGYAEATACDVGLIHAEQVGAEAIDKALRSRNPVAIKPGAYTVILEEYAVADILRFLNFLAFGALAVQEKRSFMAGRFGEQVFDPRISIIDDGLDPTGLPQPFDYEGVPKQKVEIIVNGVANAVVYDSYTAQKEGKDSTGHALPSPNAYGPIASNLFMSRGAHTKEQMLASTEWGLWVTRFHYVNPVHRLKAILTGMTRDGTFLIEKGEIARPVKNLRFTQGMLEALSNVDMISNTLKLEQSVSVPALKVHEFFFSGVTEF